MKVLYLGSFDFDWNTESYVARAFERLGHEVRRLNEADTNEHQLGMAIRETQPALFLFAKGRLNGNFDPAVSGVRQALHDVRGLCRNVCCWVFDLLAHEYSRQRWTWARSVNELVDTFFVTDGYSATKLSRAVVLRQGVPDDYRTGMRRPEWIAPVAFLGGAYGERKPLLDLVATEVKNRLGTPLLHVQTVRGADLSDMMASVGCVFGPHWPAYPSYGSNRAYVVAGYGGCFVCPVADWMTEEGWVAGEHYRPYDPGNRWDAVEQVLVAVGDREGSAAIAARAAKFARSSFSYDRRVQQLVDNLK